MTTRTALAGLLFFTLSAAVVLHGQATTVPPPPARQTGPVIEGFGGVFDVAADALAPEAGQVLMIRFDVGAGPDPGTVNTGFDTVARFLNMHVRAGVPRERLKAAIVIHGTAGKDALTHAAYRRRFGTDNPNVPLLEALAAAGVRIYFCGQTSVSRNLPAADLVPVARMTLSAMTAHLALDREGYVLNPF